MVEPEETSRGLFKSLRRLATTLVAVFQNRVELFAVEMQEERHRLVEVLVLAGGALVLATLAVLVFSAVLICLFAEPYRIYAALGIGVLYVLGAVGLAVRLKERLRTEPFTETLNQIKKDCECLTPPE
ncbi:MAG TPA: phage holin family protein [Candidatus Acidoferrum sp.]|jgi:uncharacterized membrane protein YqjE|nr:phage holin family protein [Candidatus Acidoferrum sp.]